MLAGQNSQKLSPGLWIDTLRYSNCLHRLGFSDPRLLAAVFSSLTEFIVIITIIVQD
jgi:hypothetical protein